MKLSKLLKQHLAKKEAVKEFEQVNLAIETFSTHLEKHKLKGAMVLKLWDRWDKLQELRKGK